MPPPSPLKHVQLFDFTRVYTCKGMWYVLETKHHFCLKLIQLTEMSVDRDLPLCLMFFVFFFFPSVEECGLICVVYLHPY